jgi:cytochrome P450
MLLLLTLLLPPLQACIKEVLRLYPAIPVFPREAAADDVLASGHPVSKGGRAGRNKLLLPAQLA